MHNSRESRTERKEEEKKINIGPHNKTTPTGRDMAEDRDTMRVVAGVPAAAIYVCFLYIAIRQTQTNSLVFFVRHMVRQPNKGLPIT